MTYYMGYMSELAPSLRTPNYRGAAEYLAVGTATAVAGLVFTGGCSKTTDGGSINAAEGSGQ